LQMARLSVPGALVTGALVTGAGLTALPNPAAGAATATAAVPATSRSSNAGFVEVWSHALPDAGAPVALSSPNIATLDGVPAVVVGDRAGHLYAFSLATGNAIPGWPASTGGIPIDSTPSVAPLGKQTEDGPPDDDTVFVGVGDAATPHRGGYEAFNPDGTRRWYRAVRNPATDTSAKATAAVRASLTVGDLQGGTDVVAPSVGQEEYALNAATGSPLKGFPWFTSDSDFSTPALADLYGNGQTEIVEGGDQTAGLANWVQYTQGGHLRVISPEGTAGTGSPTGGLSCEYNADQVVESSPAVGQFLAGGSVGIVVGTGTYFQGALDTDKLLAFGTHCNLVWQAELDGSTGSSPALAALSGNGTLAVLEGTDNGHGGGSVYELDGPTGAVIWQQQVEGEVIGSVVTADLNGGDQDVIVPTTNGADVLNGSNGALLGTLESGVGLQNSPLVTDDPDGRVGVTVAGYNAKDQGVIDHFELYGSSGAHVDALGAWPMFHHDPRLTGNATAPGAAALAAGPPRADASHARRRSSCPLPAGRVNGYYEVDTGGAVFAYGNLAYCGSLAGTKQKYPVVGIAATADGGGYWLVNSAGEVFSFGDAPFYGPAKSLQLQAPVIAITPTPDRHGYWLVAENGQVFAYGDAVFYGPTAKLHLKTPVIAIASTPDGHGYWLVAENGAIYTFGDAVARSSSKSVSSTPVVGIAVDTATSGYWLVGTAGIVDAFDAPALGSIAGHGIADPISGIEALPDGAGYRLVDTGGELFCYGLATDLGTASTSRPQSVVVGIATP
jgi:PQQ-like domain